MQDMNAAPLNPLPLVVWVLALPMIAMELVLAAAGAGLVGGAQGIGWRLQALERLAFSPDLMRYLLETGQFPLDGWHRLVSYPFVHGSLTHVIFAVVILLALGKMVGEVFRWWAVLLIFFASAIVGALVYTLALPGVRAPLIGAYPAVYGLIGGFTFLLWVNLAAVGANKYRAFTLIGFLLGIQLIFGLLFGGGYEWVADLTGFATGFVLSFVVSPGGWGRVLEKVRQR
ncbi:MAG: rhomboid family intramembrane serine protease [Pseudotabrizicola sp.]|uniref:rhomboid family intramembrane serine protease n=1 Tax=Pseudotabrizicola sp. TaxID=2939647 RepID=UPI00271958D4|nr:rhomboid family intramembrane serine protease [Pseudotabrizicola sp.]MDO9641433.1 rhomboid family intramembrane serine protease [Pseudotabrizicola sp.]